MNRHNSAARWGVLGACMLALSSGAAFAQSAEETIVYMLHGITNAPVTMNGTPPMTIQPATDGYGVELLWADKLGARISYTRVDDCHYDMTLSTAEDGDLAKPIVENATITLDWSKVSGVKLTTPPGIAPNIPLKFVNVDGLAISACKSIDPNVCKDMRIKFVLETAMNVGDPARTAKAYDYFKKNFCEGAAF